MNKRNINQKQTNEQKQWPCGLCNRMVRKVSKHHLVPKSQGGTETVLLCGPCHKTLHKFFHNKTLAQHLYTIENLQQDADIARYLTWVRKQPDQAIKVAQCRQKR
jgi:5-methylcytosine-specific restriction enzyme A